MDRFINVALIKEPVNWIIVTLMVMTAATMIALVIPHSSSADADE